MTQKSNLAPYQQPRKPKNSKPKITLANRKIYSFGGWVFYVGVQSIACIAAPIPSDALLWHIGWAAGLSAFCFRKAAQCIASRRSRFAKGVIISLNVLLHILVFEGYQEVASDSLTGTVLVHMLGWLVIALTISKGKSVPRSSIRDVSGARLYDINDVRGIFDTPYDGNPHNFYNFAGVLLPVSMMAKHSFILGMSETGKSIWHAIMMRFFVQQHTKGIVHDYGNNQTAKLVGQGVHPDRVIKANSFDIKTSGWLISDDCDGKSACKEFGKIPFPVKAGEKDGHFKPTAADIVGSVIYNFYRRSRSEGKEPFFTFADVSKACLSRERIYAILSLYPDTKAAFSYLKSDNETTSSYMSTIRQGLQEFEAINALDHRAIMHGRIFSAKRWISSNEIVLLGNERKRAKKALATYNAAMLTMMFRTILARETSDKTPNPYIGIFLDEFANIGRIDDLAELVREARRHGVSINLANQDMMSLEEKYGKGEFGSIIGQIKNWIVLALANRHDQQFAADLFGKMKFEKRVRTDSSNTGNSRSRHGGGSSSSSGTSYTWQQREEYLIMPSAFQGLSRVDFDSEKPMEIMAKIDTKYNFRAAFNPSYLLQFLPSQNEELKPLNYTPAPTSWEELEPWTEEDYRRLCLPLDIFRHEQQDTESPLLTGLEPLEMEIEFDDEDEEEEDDDFEGFPSFV